jgi:Clp amino terminal domain, pathogenicity island component
MFGKLKARIRDMGTVKTLCIAAERHARDGGEEKPGAEHFLLAALDLPDGTARRAFERLGADADGFKDAIARQYTDALRGVGLAPESIADSEVVVSVDSRLYVTKPSGQAVMQQLAARRKVTNDAALVGAQVVEVVASMQHGVAVRSLRTMGVDLVALRAAARAEAAGFRD